MAENKILPGSTEKLGAIYDGKGVNFALFSENATKVELCLFDENENEMQNKVAVLSAQFTQEELKSAERVLLALDALL